MGSPTPATDIPHLVQPLECEIAFDDRNDNSYRASIGTLLFEMPESILGRYDYPNALTEGWPALKTAYCLSPLPVLK